MSAFNYRPEDAFHGPLGELAKRAEKQIEVDPLTFLVQLLVAVGAMIGRRVSIDGGYTPHHCNLFALVVGDTGVGKGSAWSLAQRFVVAVDPHFRARVSSDVQSAPGLIQLVTDGTRRPAKKHRGMNAAESWEWVIPPVNDKRLLVCNEEMQTILTAKNRKGATLSELLKLAWDGKTLENNAKEQTRATDPHIALIGHITPSELLYSLGHSRQDRSNGYHNRFIFVRARRVRTLPFGGNEPAFDDLAEKVRAVLDEVSDRHLRLTWADDSKEEWVSLYEACKRGDPFLSGLDGIRDRLYCHIMRVAMLLAFLDRKSAIHREHLDAAKAICLPALDGCRDLFSPETANNETMRCRVMKAAAGLKEPFNATAIWKAIGKHGDRDALSRVFSDLVESGEWTARSERGGNNREVTYYSVAEASAGPSEAPHQEACVYDGHRIGLGQRFVVPSPMDSLDLNDRPIGVPAGATAHLAQNPSDATREDLEWLEGWFRRKPNHRLVVLAGTTPVLMPHKKSLELAMEAAKG